MDFELPFLSRIRATHVPELSTREALHHMAKVSNRGRRPRKVKVAGRIKGPLRSESPDETSFILEDEGTQLTVKVPRLEAAGLVPGQRVIMEGLLLLTATDSALRAILKGRRVPDDQLRGDSALERTRPRLRLADFFQVHESGLVILGSERAIHDVDEELKKQRCYPGPYRREIVRMTQSADVLAAARRYAGVAQAVLFVRRGGDSHEFRFWSDPAFIEDLFATELHIYLGLGHADDRTALDPLADETFPTASAAGTALAQALLALRDVKPAVKENSEPPEFILRDPKPEVKKNSEPSAIVPHESKPVVKAVPHDSKPTVKEELYLSNTVIWAVALILGAIVLIVGLR